MITKPMLFSSPMIRALLDGSKTMTRRAVKFPVIDRYGTGCEIAGSEINSCLKQGLEICRHPVGSFIWCKETWAETESDGGPVITYRAGGHMMIGATGDKRHGTWKEEIFPGITENVIPPERWKPSIFMPRKFSRITLEVTAVRVERLQDISEEDAKKEGVEQRMAGDIPMFRDYSGRDEVFTHDPRISFRSLWESIHGLNSWSKNPFLWVYSLNRI